MVEPSGASNASTPLAGPGWRLGRLGLGGELLALVFLSSLVSCSRGCSRDEAIEPERESAHVGEGYNDSDGENDVEDGGAGE